MKMSGDIFQPLDSFDDLDVSKWNPLLCYLCNEKYDDPCILGCYHSFCCRCVRGRAKDGKINCPLCGSETTIKEGMGSPPADQLMKFLVESSIEEKEKCANCDNETEQMFFCNTCSQPLCSTCRDDTHKAKMFARHEIVVLSKRTKEIHRECCKESRSYCVDLETAYNQGCKKLDHSLQAIRELQHSVRDALLLLRALLEEIKQNADVEKKAIIDLYDSMQNKIAEKKTELLYEVDSQYDGKEKLFKAQLLTLSTLLPTLHMHLVTSAAFSSSANKYEFLDLVYILMERLKSIIHLQHPLHPPHGSQIYTDYKSQFATCLEPLLFPHRNTSALPTIATTSPLTLVTNTQARLEQTVSTSVNGHLTAAPGGMALSFNGNGRRFLNRSMSIVKSSDIKSTFTDHCTDFDSCHKEITSAVDKLKNNVQELQRDLTLRRCLARKSTVSDLISSISKMEDNIDLHYSKVEQKKPLLEKHWEESLQRIATEQEIYQAQLHDVLRLKQETGYLKTIVNKLSSFVKSIAAVTERIAPKLSLCDKECEHESTMHALFEQINTMQPDSQQRVDAIRTAQEERETTMTANKTNLMDEELIKTKGLLKAPSARVLSRRDSNKAPF
ncbi:hypothetical protein KUTeg_002440 [Tegillarca granosa]|uniref:RING finger protein 207 n=1 Tax=Tegillarca granosa TaxID=220873 RepID=A0ABQ9FUA9_TEGGR|nr:hypothetical protein KUTeg_002440 [Tegillarca granosa]